MKSTKSKGRETQTQDDIEMCYRRENQHTPRKTSQGYQEDPPSLIYPMTWTLRVPAPNRLAKSCLH